MACYTNTVWTLNCTCGATDIQYYDCYGSLITIDPFVNPQDKRKVKLKPFHLIVGENSGSIFDVFNTDEIARVKKGRLLRVY